MLSRLKFGDGTLKGVNETDLINTAAKVIVEKGYANSSFKEIALRLNTSEEAVKITAGSMESLYAKVILHFADTEKIFADCDSLLEMLIVLIEAMKADITENSIRAKLFDYFISAKDTPKSVEDALLKDVESSKLYKTVSMSQLEGEILSGNTYEVIKMFVISTFKMIQGHIMGKLKVPDNDYFIRIIKFKDDDSNVNSEEVIKKQNSVIAAFASDFHSILFVDLDTDQVEVYQANGEHDNWIIASAAKGFEEYRRRFAEKFLLPEDQEWFLKEMESENIKNNLMEDPVFYVDHKILNHGKPISYQTKVCLDPMYSYGNKVLIGGHRLYDD